MTRLRTSSIQFGAGLVLLVMASALAEENNPSAVAIDPIVGEQVRQAIAGLDSEKFSARDDSAQRLQRLAENPDLGVYLVSEFQRVMLLPDTSFEVRAQLERLLKQLPPGLAAADTKPSLAELGAVLDRTNSDSSAVRDSAQRRLSLMLRQAQLTGPMMLELKARLADPQLNTQTRRTLEPLLDQAREAWLLADPASVPLPPVSAEQMARWIDDFLLPEADDAGDRLRAATAQRELLDLMARDDARPVLLELLAQRIEAAQESSVRARLQEISDFSKPAMVAEVWKNHQHLAVQHLIVGVPQIPESPLPAPRATHFDRIDEQTAHCVSGSNLTPGDYPVGVAIPHPDPNQDFIYYLINLPTPRRHLAYEYRLKRDEGWRMREISRRTTQDFLTQARVLSESQVLMLAGLDPTIVSRFAGAYFQAVPDSRLVTSTAELAGQLSIHSAICYMLSQIGTHEAVPALEQLARSGALGKPNLESPYQIAWIAALAIAARDPWPQVDAWLAGLIDDETPLVSNLDPAPELGATAAGMLLDRQGVSTRPFGLELVGQPVGERFRFAPYRFLSAKDHEDVRRWWNKQKDALGKKPPATLGQQDGSGIGPSARSRR
jgi:hypothetical protein